MAVYRIKMRHGFKWVQVFIEHDYLDEAARIALELANGRDAGGYSRLTEANWKKAHRSKRYFDIPTVESVIVIEGEAPVVDELLSRYLLPYGNLSRFRH